MDSAGVDHLSAAQHGSIKLSQGDRTLEEAMKSRTTLTGIPAHHF